MMVALDTTLPAVGHGASVPTRMHFSAALNNCITSRSKASIRRMRNSRLKLFPSDNSGRLSGPKSVYQEDRRDRLMVID